MADTSDIIIEDSMDGLDDDVVEIDDDEMEDENEKDTEKGIKSKLQNGHSPEEYEIVEDEEEEKQKEKIKIKLKMPKNDSKIKSEERVFVKKKILSDDEWFAGIGSKELKFYKKNMMSEEKMDENTIVCTACYRQMNHKIPGMVLRHPDLGVPVCKQCKKFYHGEWTRDADGYFEFCRWCANGGDLLLCDCCSNAFCKKCIKRNLGRSKVSQIEDLDEWECLLCDSSQVWKQRAMYYSVYIYLKNQKSDDEKKIHKKKQLRPSKNLPDGLESTMPESSFFLDETIRDCFDVHKILGNYLDRAKKSWAKKRDEYENDDVIKATVKLRTIFNITHHNLQLLDKNLVSGCSAAVPGTSTTTLRPGNVPGLNTESDIGTNDDADNFNPIEITTKEEIIDEDRDQAMVEDNVKQEDEIEINESSNVNDYNSEDLDSIKKENKKIKSTKKVKNVGDIKKEEASEETKKMEVNVNEDANEYISEADPSSIKKKNMRTTPIKTKKTETSEDIKEVEDSSDEVEDNIEANKVKELNTSADMFEDSGNAESSKEEQIENENIEEMGAKNTGVEESETSPVNGIEHAEGDIILDTRRINNKSSIKNSATDEDEEINKESTLDRIGVSKITAQNKISDEDERAVSRAVSEGDDKGTESLHTKDSINAQGSGSVSDTGEVCDGKLPIKEIEKSDKVTKISDRNSNDSENNENPNCSSILECPMSPDMTDKRAANLAAKAAVLMSTSSDEDTLQVDQEEEVSPRKRLKTKKELDKMRRQSGNEDNEVGTDTDAELPTTPKSKLKKKIDTLNKGTPLKSEMVEESGGDGKSDSDSILGIASDSEDEPTSRKKRKDKNVGKTVKKKQEKDNDKLKKKLKGIKKVLDCENGKVESDAEEADDDEDLSSEEESIKSSDDESKPVKKDSKKRQKQVQEMIDSVDIKRNKKLKCDCGVDIIRMMPAVKDELQKFDEVDIKEFKELRMLSQGKGKKKHTDIDRLCDFKALKKLERGNSSGDERSDDNERHKTKKVNGPKVKKDKKKIGDMSSDEGSGADKMENSEDEEVTKVDLKKTKAELAKASVLASSSDENDENNEVDTSDDDTDTKKEDKKTKTVGRTELKNGNLSNGNNNDKKNDKKSRPALLSMKLSETDSSEAEANYRKKKEKVKDKDKHKQEDNSDSDFQIQTKSRVERIRAARKRKTMVQSDSDIMSASESEEEEEKSDSDSDSDVVTKKRVRKKKKTSSSNSDSESDQPRKRRRIKANSDDSDAENKDDDGDENSPSKGRHHIRKIIKDSKVAASSKEAAQDELERRKRIEEKQKEYNKIFETTGAEGKETDRLILDFDPETKEVLVEVHKKIVSKLKPHQLGGIKFMWDAVFESVAMASEGKQPGGAILAHCMGLGKTLQTVGLAHTVLNAKDVGVETVLIICPVNTVKNWEDEFEKWLKGNLELDVYGMTSEKDNWGRADKLNAWNREGGVLIIGYDMFRNLSNTENKKFKSKQRETFKRCLLDPGPDLIVCDEGHLLKNEKSAINRAMMRLKSLRRIVLTGTPLQNNLKEYYAMVNFVKPNLLGTNKEFLNRFVNPIVNGQHSDSTERDVRIMKKRSFVLSDLLKGCTQRLDYSVLAPYLQPKLEYVICLNLTSLQKKLYQFYLENYAKAGQIGPDGKLQGGKKGGLFYDVQNLSRIWNHPYILVSAKRRQDMKDMFNDNEDDEEGSLKDFIDDKDTESESDGAESGSGEDSDVQLVEEEATKKKRTTRGDKTEDLVGGLESVPASQSGWWSHLMDEKDDLENLNVGAKMVLLMDILKESEMIGDKVLLFSQSILSLDLIEDFLAKVDGAKDVDADSGLSGFFGTRWVVGKDYYRMDGSTAADTRKIWCKYFNKPTSHRMRLFLISTKAGGLGINLVAANRVIIFDASWNPSHDVQSIFRVYRFGQTKPVYIYRFLAKGTMEEKIYDRQVTKQSMSARVVDEQQIERHFTMNELSELYEFQDEPPEARPIPIVPKDRMLAELIDKHKDLIWKYHIHDSLLENKEEQNLSEADRKAAWEEFENEKKGLVHTNVGLDNTLAFGAMLQNMLPRGSDGRVMASPINPMAIQEQLRQQNPELSHEELVMRTRTAIMQLQNLHRTPTPVVMNPNTLAVGSREVRGYDQSYYKQEMARARASINNMYPGMYRFRGPEPQQGQSIQSQASLLLQQQKLMMQAMASQASRNLQASGSQPQYKTLYEQRLAQMSAAKADSSGPEEITLDGEPTTGQLPNVHGPTRGRTSSPARGATGGRAARGGRRGRPRLDPDTDLDFSPAPMDNEASQLLLQRLQQSGMSVTPNDGNKTSDGNESWTTYAQNN